MLQIAGLSDRLIDITLYIYIAGIVGNSLYHLWGFSQGVKILKSGSSACFMGLQVIKEIVHSVLWPFNLVIFALQLPFSIGTVNDFNRTLGEYNGYDLENDEEDD